MASSFVLTLDTTGPAGVTLVLAGAASVVSLHAITAAIATTDPVTTGYQMKIWGDVDPAVNANIQTTEAASSWITFTAAQALTLSTGDALKTINVRLRDDVLNESAVATDTITLNTAVPVITIVGPDVAKVSEKTGASVANFSFTADVALAAYKVKVVPAVGSLENAGTQIPTTGGSVNLSGGAVTAGATVNASISAADLKAASAGDGPKTIKVFGQAVGSGLWSVV